ncbi:hypothetical protein H671_2g7717 [Cricetulus griseus]|nr:hypothetical protein H671_2g7717 [Cricetulus griseus]
MKDVQWGFARTSRAIFKKYGESGQPYLIHYFRGINLMLACCILFYYVKSVYMVDYIDEFLYVEPALHPCNEAYLIMVDHFFDMFLDSICHYFIEYFCINVH